MNKVVLILTFACAALSVQVQADTIGDVFVERNGSYSIDRGSIVQSNGKMAYTLQTIYTTKMMAPNGAEYTKEVDTLLADCKNKTQAVTGTSLMDGTGKVVYTYTPTVTEAPMITPEMNLLDAKIMQVVCGIK